VDKAEEVEALFPEELQTAWYDRSSSFFSFPRFYFEIKYRRERETGLFTVSESNTS